MSKRLDETRYHRELSPFTVLPQGLAELSVYTKAKYQNSWVIQQAPLVRLCPLLLLSRHLLWCCSCRCCADEPQTPAMLTNAGKFNIQGEYTQQAR